MSEPESRAFLRKHLFDPEILRLMALIILVKPLGLITQMLIAKYFGAGPEYDAFALALFVVVFIGMVLGQVFTSVVVPFVIKLRGTLEPDRLLGFQNAIIVMFSAGAVISTALLGLFADRVVDVAGPGLPDVTRGYAIRMVRYMAIPGALLLVVAMGKAVLNLNRKYRLATSMPSVHAAFILAAIILLHDRMGIWSVVVGFAVSQLLQTVLVWGRALQGRHVVLRGFCLPEGTPSKLWSLGWALLLTQSFLLLFEFIDKIFASFLEMGSISSLAYAATVKSFVIQLFQFSLVTVMFTRLSELIAADDFDECGRYIRENIGRVTRLVVPATLILALAGGEIVRVLFLRGHFTPADAERTAGVMSMYALGLPALIVNLIVSRVFHSLQRMKEKIWLGVQFLVMNVALNALLIGPLKVTGLALASTITIYCHLLLSFWVLQRYRLGLGVGRWVSVFLGHHVIAGATCLVYVASGFSGLMANWSIRGTTSGDLAIGLCKGLFVCIAYGIIYFSWRRYSQHQH